MKVQFVTSGFPNGFTASFLEQLRKFLPRTKSFVMVASDFSAHQKSERYLAQYLREFAQNGMGFSQGMLVDFSVSPQEAVSMIEGRTRYGCPAGRLCPRSAISGSTGWRTFCGSGRGSPSV